MSVRNISASIQAALQSNQHVSSVQFVRLDFPSGVIRGHTRIGPITWTHPVYGSETYTGVGDFGKISGELDEGLQNRSYPVRFFLSGVDSTLLSAVLTDNTHRQEAQVWQGLLAESGALIDTPTLLWSGFFDKADIEKGGGLGKIACTCVGRNDTGRESSGVRYTDEQQQLEQPGDLGFEYLYQLQDISLRWGDKRATPPIRPDFNLDDIPFFPIAF